MSNIIDNEKECEFNKCQTQAYRHFWFHHWCNEHNWYLRQKAQHEQPQDLENYVKQHLD